MSIIRSLCVMALALRSAAAFAHIGPQPPGVVAGTGGRELPAPVTAPALRLAILPDRTTGEQWGLAYLAMAIEDLNRMQPDAVISIGDMIQGYTRSTEQWDREVREFESYTDLLSMPFYPLVGNHEVVSGTRDAHDATFHRRYREAFGPLFYMLEFDLATVICLDSDDLDAPGAVGIGPHQEQWLQASLARAGERGAPILVLLHRPLWRTARAAWDQRIHPRLKAAGVDAVVAGHFHAMQRDPDRDGVQYHIVGACGGMIDQHPYTGQLQHLTFITVGLEGMVDIFHQPVGTTLPDDFVVAEDQDRVQQLKAGASVTWIGSVVTDPVHAAFDGEVQVKLSNPIDRPVCFEVELIHEPPKVETAESRLWVSRTQIDLFNPYTTDVETSWSMPSFPAIVLDPGESTITRIRIKSPQIEQPRNPPEFHIRASFEDSRHRTTPVIIRRRLPMQRTIEVGHGMTAAQPWPLCAWHFSFYELQEPNPTATLCVDDVGRLVIRIESADGQQSGHSLEGPVAERWRDPAADAVVVILSVPDGQVDEQPRESARRVFYTEPFLASTVWEVSEGGDAVGAALLLDSIEVDSQREAGGWVVTLALPDELWRPELGGVGMGTLQIGVADNDGDFHTQWRWLAPPDHPALVRLRPR